MKILTAKDLKDWSGELSGKSILPLLVRRLILATIDTQDIKYIHFPFGEEVQTGGYDGELVITKGNLFAPSGQSVWEFGVSEKKKKKADEDYEKRKKNTLGKVSKKTTYINVNTKGYTKKIEWANEKKTENFWMDVKYYDAIEIEQWLDLAPSVEFWLAGILNKPHIGVRCADDYWKDWSTNPNMDMQFSTKILTGGREKESKELLLSLNQSSICKYIVSNTKEESLGYILAVCEEIEAEEKTAIQSKTLVVDNPDDFIKLTEIRQNLILIPTFEVDQVKISRAINNRHTVIIPESSGFIANRIEPIYIPLVSSSTLNEGLVQTGIDEEQAKLLTKNTGRNIAVLRRTLGFDQSRPEWLDDSNDKNLIPFLFISRFNNAFEGDREILTSLSNESVDDYIRFLKKINSGKESPLYNVTDSWRLISHTDAWVYLAPLVTDNDLNSFIEIAIKVLTEEDPTYNINPKERQFVLNRNNQKKYSSELTQGICETLIVLSVYSKEFGINTTIDVDSSIKSVVEGVLKSANEVTLRSLKYHLHLIAEASPTTFLNGIQRIIDDGRINTFFEIETGLIHSSNHLPHLLWALEKLAWIPENITQVCDILCQLENHVSEELPTSNTPLNTLKSIFRAWLPQTNLSFEERKQVLNSIKKKHPEIASKIFESHLFDGGSVAFSSQRMRWRCFDETRKIQITNQEIIDACDFAIDNLLELSENDVHKLCLVIKKLNQIKQYKVNDIISAIKKLSLNLDEEKALVYHTLRELIGDHRTYRTADWSLPERLLRETEVIAKGFTPTDIIQKDSYLFENHAPIPFEGTNYLGDYQKQEEELLTKRINFITKVVSKYDLKKVVSLAANSKNPWFYAQALAKSNLSESQELDLIGLLKSEDEKVKLLGSHFISVKSTLCTFKEMIIQFETLKKTETTEFLNEYLLALNYRLELWTYIELELDSTTEKIYWENYNQYLGGELDSFIYAISKLAQYDRTLTVLNTFNNYLGKLNEIPTEFVINLLENLKLSDYVKLPNSSLNPYGIQHLFEHLQSLSGLNLDRMATLEYRYLNVFNHYGMNKIEPKYLFKAIGQNPEFFSYLINTLYKSEDDSENTNNEVVQTPEEIELLKIKGAAIYHILARFNSIQGVNNSEAVDVQAFNSWIDEVRRLGLKNKRLGITDEKIGEILGRNKAIEVDQTITDVVYQTIERIDSNQLNFGFKLQLFNNLGTTSRPSGAGGTIEKDRSDHFLKLSEKLKFTHSVVSKIYRQLSSEYNSDAQRMDNSAYKESLEY